MFYYSWMLGSRECHDKYAQGDKVFCVLISSKLMEYCVPK